VLQKGITWEWETFPQFLDAAERHRPALNLDSSRLLRPSVTS
jgi:hypothetical protein